MTYKDKITFKQTRDPTEAAPNRFSFGLVLENTSETPAKEIGITMNIYWVGGDMLQEKPIVEIDYYRLKRWSSDNNQIGDGDRPAVLNFHGSDQDRCFLGQPLKWPHFKLELRERVAGSFLLGYEVASAQPVSRNNGELKIILE